MLPRNLFRTSSFRQTLLTSGIFCLALLVLSNFIIAAMLTTIARHNDHVVEGEINEIFNDAKDDLAHLTATVARMSATSPQFFYALQNRNGVRLAGNLSGIIEPITGTFEWPNGQGKGAAQPTIRGIGLKTIDGAYLFVGTRAFKTTKMYAIITRYFLWITGFTFIAIFSGGLFLSDRVLARVEAISLTSREIVSGDLKRRIPLSGANDEFDHLVLSLNVMFDRIQNLMEGLRQVSSDIAHDLRTPFTRLRHRLEHARDNATTVDELRDVMDQSIKQVDLILAIFSSLLRIAQIESGIRQSSFKKVDLAKILSEAVGLYLPVFEEKAQRIITNIVPDLMVAGDSELLTQLFVNALDNAMHHTPKHSTVMVKAFIKDDHVIVEIADDGPGIPEAMRSRVFQRFFRLEQSRSTPGHGLGLSLIAAVTEQHHGSVELADNNPGLSMKITFAHYALSTLPNQKPLAATAELEKYLDTPC